MTNKPGELNKSNLSSLLLLLCQYLQSLQALQKKLHGQLNSLKRMLNVRAQLSPMLALQEEHCSLISLHNYILIPTKDSVFKRHTAKSKLPVQMSCSIKF